MSAVKANHCLVCGYDFRDEYAIPLIHIGPDGRWPEVSYDLAHVRCIAEGVRNVG